MHNILAFYVLMVIHKVASTILPRKRIIYQFSRMVASCKRLVPDSHTVSLRPNENW